MDSEIVADVMFFVIVEIAAGLAFVVIQTQSVPNQNIYTYLGLVYAC